MSDANAELPAAYFNWLAQLGSAPRVEFDDVEWELAAPAKLKESIVIDKQQAPFVEQTRLYAKTLAEYMPHLEDGDDEPVEFERVAKFLTIGMQNEELLCVDPADKFSVWTFLPGEGGLLERVSKSLAAFMKKAKPIEDA